MDLTALETVRVRIDAGVCFLQLHRPEARNAINARMVADCTRVLDACEAEGLGVVVIEGLPDVFCFGADFGGLRDQVVEGEDDGGAGAAAMYALWTRLAQGPFISVAHVRGSVNAGGNGFVAACDIAIADPEARFGLSELLFGLYPACVLPFLIRRIGLQRAHYLTVSTQPIGAAEACLWGLVDRVADPSDAEVQRHLRRLRLLPPASVAAYKGYLARLSGTIDAARADAVGHNRSMHALPGVIEGIVRYAETGRFPWHP